ARLVFILASEDMAKSNLMGGRRKLDVNMTPRVVIGLEMGEDLGADMFLGIGMGLIVVKVSDLGK
ncbi:hypothetical protein KI387_033102, partial [Taxus chinensis]